LLISWLFSCSLCFSWHFLLCFLDFDWCFCLRSLHIVFLSGCYFLLYLHIFRCIFYMLLFDCVFLVWFFGFLLYVFLLLIAFIGYVLPCTQMSYWGLTVFSNILSTIPIIGVSLCYWLWCYDFIQDFTLYKLHSLHIVFPFVFLFLVFCHLFFLHVFLSSDGFLDRYVLYMERILFFVWYLWRDFLCFFVLLFFVVYFFVIWWYFVFHEESWCVCNVLATSDKILPEWFFFAIFWFFEVSPG